MTTGILEKLKATPFWLLLAPIINREITKKDVRTNNFSMSIILQSYSKEDGGFQLGGKILKIRPIDFTAILGIKGGSSLMKINKDQTPKRNHKKDRLLPYFPIGSRITSTELKNAVLKLTDKSNISAEEEEDVAILIVLHLLSNFFLAGSRNECPWGWAPFVTDFTNINEWDWAASLCNYLTSYLDEGLKDNALSCHGCVPLIVYAISEHTNIFKPTNPTKFPRFLKWDYTSLSKEVTETAYRRSQVNVHKLELSDREVAALGLAPTTASPIKASTIKASPKKAEPIKEDNASLKLELKIIKVELEKLKKEVKENASIKREVKILNEEIEKLKKELETEKAKNIQLREAQKKSVTHTIIKSSKKRNLLKPKPKIMKRITRSSKHTEDPAIEKKRDAALKAFRAKRNAKTKLDMPAVSEEIIEKKADSIIPQQDASKEDPMVTEEVETIMIPHQDLKKDEDTPITTEDVDTPMVPSKIENEVIQENVEDIKKDRSLIVHVKERKRVEKMDSEYVYELKKKAKVVGPLPTFDLKYSSQEDKSEKCTQPSPPQVEDPQQPNPSETDAHPKADDWIEYKFPNNSICNAMLPEDKEKVITYNRVVKGLTDFARRGPGGDILMSELEEVWNSGMIDSGFIDLYCYLLQSIQQEKWENGTPKFQCENRVGMSFFILSHSWSCVYSFKNENLIKQYNNNVMDAMKSGCRFIHFPMTVPGKFDEKFNPSPTPSHWVLFVFDTQQQTWSFYNSLKGRTSSVDFYYKNGLVVVKHAEKIWNKCAMDSNLPRDHWARKKKNHIQYINTSPQQGKETLDCGIIVMYVMSCYVKGEPIIEVLHQSELEQIKLEIIHRIINDKWSFNTQDFLEGLAAMQMYQVEDQQDETAAIVSSVVQSVNNEHKEPRD